jgi:sulfatase maturation enzyme AslB (radical SAM superfamily)
MTIDDFICYGEKLKKYGVLSGFITGGEPTLNKDCPEILEEAIEIFPINVTLSTNLCNSSKTFFRSIQIALSHNLSIETSLDGFQQTNNILRPAASNIDTYNAILKNMIKIIKLKRKMKSESFLGVNITVSKINIKEVLSLIKFVQKIGWAPSIQLVQNTGDLALKHPNKKQRIITTSSYEFKSTINEIKKIFEHDSFSKDYFDWILGRISGTEKKYCPYQHIPIVFKIWPDGSISICSSKPIGNLNYSDLDQIFNSSTYYQELKKLSKCKGCSYPLYIGPKILSKKLILNILNGAFTNILM